jgi:hypothetical protein
MSAFERYLTLWVFLCIVIGIFLGETFPGVVETIGDLEIASVNIPVGILIWVMIIPMLLKVDFVHQLGGQTLFDGATRMGIHFTTLCALAPRRPSGELHRGTDTACRSALYRHGLCLESADKR